jgi:hypothetical protein
MMRPMMRRGHASPVGQPNISSYSRLRAIFLLAGLALAQPIWDMAPHW